MTHMRRATLVHLLLLVTAYAGCAYRPQVSEPDGAALTTIRPTFDKDGVPHVALSIAGERVTLLFDTGSNDAISLRAPAARRCGAAFTAATARASDAFGRTVQRRRFAVERVAFDDGGAAFDRVEGLEVAEEGGPAIDGLLGLALLRCFDALLLDLAEPSVTLLRGAPPPEPYAAMTPEPVEISPSFGILLETTIDGRPARLILDTGASHSVLRLGVLEPTRHEEGAAKTGLGTTKMRIPFAAPRSMEIRGQPCEGPEFALIAMNLPVDGVLGMDFLRRHRVAVDFRAGTLRFAPR